MAGDGSIRVKTSSVQLIVPTEHSLPSSFDASKKYKQYCDIECMK